MHPVSSPVSGLKRLLLAALLTYLCVTQANAAIPVAPSNLRGAVVTSTSFNIVWDDNSTDETNFELLYSIDGGAVNSITLGASAGTGTLSTGFSGLPAVGNIAMQIRASNASGSSLSNVVTLIFNVAYNAPVSPLLKTASDGSVLVMWSDNASTEAGYSVEIATASGGPYTVMGYTPGANYTGMYAGSLAPGTTYYFRVRAFQGSPTSQTNYSAYSPVVSITTSSTLAAPTSLVVTATAPAETSVNFAFDDNTFLNTGYEIEYGLSGSGSFVYFGEAGDYGTISATNSVAPGTAYDFRVRAFYQSGSNPRVYSAYSNTASYTTPFSAPTSLVATATSESAVNLTWTDNSAAEGGYAVYAKASSSGTYTLFGYTAANATSQAVSGLTPGTSYDFLVKAAYSRSTPGTATIVESTASNTATVTAKDGFTSRTYQPITYNQPFSYQATVSTGSARSSWNITGLPTGLAFNSSTGVVSGTPSVTGVFVCPMTATFANGWTTNSSLTLRVIRAPGAPVVGTAISSQTIANGGNTSVSLTGKFSDPDAESAVRVTTNLGVMDFILYNTATPQTVTNFLSYVNNASSTGNFNGAVFHRSIPGFIVQGGAFKVQSAPNNFTSVTTVASPVNEPGISNLRGTVAMAKLGSDPNSATDQFFVNLADNSSNLDNQNGGFTAFARVAGSGMSVADAIAGLPTVSSSVNIDGSATTSLTDWPLTSASASMDTSKVVSITSAAPVAVLSYSVTGNTNPTAVSASVSGSDIQINGLAAGTSNLTVTATDLDGNTVTQTFTVNVTQGPAFTSAAPTSPAIKGAAYSFTCTASGYPAPTFAVTAGSLPTGLSLASGGAITGTPSVTGTFTGTITATNSVGTATQNFSITVNEVPAFTSAAPTGTGLVGTAYSFSCTASGTPAPTFSVTAGALPNGLSLASGGAITGTPTTAGTFTGTITATNSAGTATQDFSITVNQAPAFTSSAPTGSAVVGSAYNFTCTASGSPSPTFAVTTGALPTGLSLASNGVISGTPSVGGTFTGTITATNAVSSVNQSFSITVTVVLSNWATSKGLTGGDALPAADPDHDGRSNLLEFALMTEPTVGDGGAVPSYVLAKPGGTGYGEITFPVRKFAPSLTYSVEVSDTLVSGSWTTIWTSADGFGAAVVSATTDQSDRTILTVRDTQPSPPAVRRFMRVTVTSP